MSNKFPFTPTEGQILLFNLFDKFLEETNKKSTLVIQGYAGTGKTTVVSTICEVIPLFNYKFVLMAPTGRAAKIMSNYSGKPAFTIHKKIYKQMADPQNGELKFQRVKNYHKDTVFIVDEASMLSNDGGFKNSVLTDVISYVFQNISNKLILVGDLAQLPPVGKTDSPALDKETLSFEYGLQVISTELTQVMRQELSSGILNNATLLRDNLNAKKPSIQIKTSKFKDIYAISAEKLEDGLRYAYDKVGIENTTIICRSNWQAVQYNQLIRRNILFYNDEIEAGDILMVVKNNYYYLEKEHAAGFIANGDFVEVRKIIDFEENYGFRFATLQVQLVDYPDTVPFEAKVLMDTLYSKSPALTAEDNQKLYNKISHQYIGEKSKKSYKEAISNDEYLNALQVKFAYALTCHKSQGGQWNIVFVDQGLRGEFEIDKDYIRWLYTAITRATNELYLVNFDGRFLGQKR